MESEQTAAANGDNPRTPLKPGMSILKSIFGRSKRDERGIDQLIFDLAEHGNRPADVSELYRRLPHMELFARVLSANFPLQNGSRHTIGPGQNLQIQSASLPGGQNLAQFFIDRADPRLGSHFMSVSPREACSMVLKMDALSGMVICNTKNSWVALLKPELQRLLKKELAESSASPGSPPSSQLPSLPEVQSSASTRTPSSGDCG